MKVLVTGSHGLIGSYIVPSLAAQGHQVVRLARTQTSPNQLFWDPVAGKIEKSLLEGFDAVLHLAGENIATGSWTAAKKAKIRASRVEGTMFLCQTLAGLETPPEVLISASAIGYYGDRGDEVLTEDSPSGEGFLAEVCREWEASTQVAQRKGIRTAILRIGAVLSPQGGALSKMLPPFQMGAGGRLGSGKQYMSWIALEDLAGIAQHVLEHKELSGPINAVAPYPVMNEQFTAALGTSLHRPTIFPVPRMVAHLVLGEMADEVLFASARVLPEKLLASGYSFSQPDLGPMLWQALNAA